MRMHIELDDRLVAAVDEIAGRRRRSAFVREAIRTAVDQHRRWSLVRESAGAIPDRGHEWDADPAAWVHQQRFGDPTRVG